MNKLEDLYRRAASAEEYARSFAGNMAAVVQLLDSAATAELIELVEQACHDDKTIIVMGNGGSGAVGAHWVNDLSANSLVEGQPGFRTISLTDNAFSVTALGNDASFDEIFERQLRANMREGDVVIALSVSGNSPNIVRGVEYANAHGGVTVGCTGMDGGKLKALCQVAIHTPTSKDEYGPAEDMFSVVMHVVTSYLTMKRGRMLSH